MLHAHISGALAADPVERISAGGKPYTTATVRVPVEREEAQFVAVVAFDDEARALLGELRKGDAVSLSGPAKLRTWTGNDGKERHGLSVIAQRVLGGKPEPRRRRRAAPQQPEQPRSTDAGDGFPPEAGDLSVIGGKR